MKGNAGIIALIIFALLTGCIANLKNIPREKCVAPPSDNVMKAINDNCIRCHSRDFSTKEGVCSLRTDIMDAVKTKRMPKIGTLWPEYYQTFMDWK